MTQAIGYTRASTADQEITIEAQRQDIEQYCNDNDIDLIAVYDDRGVSGKVSPLNRTGFQKALENVEKIDGEKILICSKRDRMSRNGDFNLAEYFIRKAGGTIKALDTDESQDDFTRMVMDAIMDLAAKIEHHNITQRNRRMHRHLKERGKVGGGQAPFGYRFVKDGNLGTDLAKNEVEYPTVLMMQAWREAGLSLQKIANHLNGDNLLNRGNAWSKQSVKNVLDRG